MLKHASFFVGEGTAADWLLARQCSAALYITQHRATLIIIIIINDTWEHVGSSQAQSARRKPLSLGRTSAPKPREPESASNDRTQVQSGIVVPCIKYPARKDPSQGEARRPTKCGPHQLRHNPQQGASPRETKHKEEHVGQPSAANSSRDCHAPK